MATPRINNRSFLTGLKIEKDGQWKRVTEVIDSLPIDLASAIYAGQLSAANKFKKEITNNIRRGGGSAGTFRALSVDYLAYKARAGKPMTMFTLDKHYRKSITVQQKGYKIFVGIPKGTWILRDGRAISVAMYASVLEKGRKGGKSKQAARPIWKRTWEKFGKERRIKRIISWHITTKYKKKYNVKLKL